MSTVNRVLPSFEARMLEIHSTNDILWHIERINAYNEDVYYSDSHSKLDEIYSRVLLHKKYAEEFEDIKSSDGSLYLYKDELHVLYDTIDKISNYIRRQHYAIDNGCTVYQQRTKDKSVSDIIDSNPEPTMTYVEEGFGTSDRYKKYIEHLEEQQRQLSILILIMFVSIVFLLVRILFF